MIAAIQVLACYWLKYKTATIEYWLILIFFITIAMVADLVASKLAQGLSVNGLKEKYIVE